MIILGPEAFKQEKNCDLKVKASEDVEVITEDVFLSKIDHSLSELVCPNDASSITFALDPHKNIIYFEGCAWSDGFDGHVITYGTFPKQTAANWTQRRTNACQTVSHNRLEGSIACRIDRGGRNDHDTEILS